MPNTITQFSFLSLFRFSTPEFTSLIFLFRAHKSDEEEEGEASRPRDERTQLNAKLFVPSSSVYNLTDTPEATVQRGFTLTQTHARKDEKRAPKKQQRIHVNETKHLSQTFLSRSTDKVLQPRKNTNDSLFLCKMLRNSKRRAQQQQRFTGNEMKTVV